MINIDPRWREWRHAAFIGGLSLSALTVMILLLSAYFAGTAPHLPNDVAALETLRTGGDWAAVSARPLGTNGVPSNVEASAGRVARQPNDLSHPPMDISDLPSPDHRFRSTGD
jgi:hypothetical protein